MPIIRNILFYLSLILITVQCQQKNSLAQNESKIISELHELDQLAAKEEKIHEPGKYLNIPEKPRIADPADPIVVLDILKARADVRDIRLTELYSQVRYIPIRIRPPKDSLWASFGYTNFDFEITPNNIFVSDRSCGIFQYNQRGEFVQSIVENDFHYTAIPEKRSTMISKEDRQQFVGAKGPIQAIGDMIYFQYQNNPEQEFQMRKFDARPGVLSQMTMYTDKEDQNNAPKGIPLFPMHYSEQEEMESFIGASSIFPLSEHTWASSLGTARSSKRGSFLITTDINGDTLTKFKNHDPVRNYTGSRFRMLDAEGTQYSLNGVQHIRQPHNDTIYTLHGTDWIAPKYVLDFGNKGIQSTLEGISINVDLKDKYIIQDFIETNQYLSSSIHKMLLHPP